MRACHEHFVAERFFDDGTHALFVRWIGVGMQQTDGYSLSTRGRDACSCRSHAILVERPPDLAHGAKSLGYLEAQLARHKWSRLDISKIVELRHTHAPEFQDIAKAGRGDERRARTLGLKHGVGGGRCGVYDDVDLFGANAICRKEFSYALRAAKAEIAGGRGHLSHEDPPVRAGGNDVGKCSSHIDADAVRSLELHVHDERLNGPVPERHEQSNDVLRQDREPV